MGEASRGEGDSASHELKAIKVAWKAFDDFRQGRTPGNKEEVIRLIKDFLPQLDMVDPTLEYWRRKAHDMKAWLEMAE